MEEFDLGSIPVPSPPSSSTQQPPSTTMGNGSADDEEFKRQFWEKAQMNLQQIAPPTIPVNPMPFMSYPSSQFYQLPSAEMYNFASSYNPAMLAQNPAFMQPNNDFRLTLAQQRLRAVMPQGAPIHGITPFRPNSFPNQRGGRGGMHPRPPRPPRPSFPRMPTPNVSVQASEGNFVYSDFFGRMIPENVKDFIDKCHDCLPSASMKSQLEFYLKERITPMLDSGVAARINWDSEPLPHKINFVVQMNWTPVSKMRGPGSGANNVEVSRERKRPFLADNYGGDSKNGSSTHSNQSNSKRDKKKHAANFGRTAQPSEKLQKYLNKGIGWVKEGEEVEDAQRRNKRAMRFNDGASSSGSVQQNAPRVTPKSSSIFDTTKAQPRPRKRIQNKTDDDVLSYIDRREIEQNLMKLNGVFCPKPSDKYQLLLKRDGFLSVLSKLKSKSRSSTNLAARRLGTCMDMCPEKERYMRQIGNLLHPFECNPDGSLNHKLAVKDYSRSAADQDEPLPHELRAPETLQKTMDYLILMCKKSMSKNELVRWYDFLWSRTRSIRKEITQQLLVDKLAVGLVEKCARFHIYSAYCMANLGTKEFDGRMNAEKLSKCLQTLRHLYDDLAQKSIFCETEPEFRAYDVLLNLADSNVLTMAHTYRRKVRNAPLFKLAMQLACVYQAENYVSFFRLIRQKATYLQACLCRTYFDQMRAKAIHTIVKVYRPIKYPTDKLTELLAFDNEGDTLAFMRELLLQPDEDGKIQLGSGYQAFSEIVSDTYKYGCKVVDNKLSCPLAEAISGCTIIAPRFTPPTTSFVSDYYGEKPRASRFH